MVLRAASACTRLPFALPRSWMYFAIGVEPTNEIAATSGMVEQRVDGDLVAVDDVEDAVGQPGLGVQLGDEVRTPTGRARTA